MLSSGEPVDNPGCNLRFHLGHRSLIIELPSIIKPWKQWIDTSRHNWEWTNSKGYWDEHERQYGFIISDGALHVRYGPQTHDSDTEKNELYFLPWTEWRYIRISLYDLEGNHVWTQYDKDKTILTKFQEREFARNNCPKRIFNFLDYDGEEIQVTTIIEEREWRLGTGWFKWLELFTKPKISRMLDLSFSKEVGSKKGSWKGGTTGHSIKLLPGELHESAFKRYCVEHNLTFISEFNNN